MSTDDSITIGERYTSATDSTNLKLTRLSDNRGCDADLLIAAGWLGERLGASLFRLMHEFDAVAGELRIAQAEFDRIERVACRFDAAAKKESDAERRGALAGEAVRLRKEASSQALSNRLLMLQRLKGLPGMQRALAEYALEQSVNKGYGLTTEMVVRISRRVLEVFIDEKCHDCQGRGKNGGYGGAPVAICRTCGGSQKRSQRDTGADAKQIEFGAMLLDHMRRMQGYAAASIKSRTAK